jgi:hypothetical protein
MTIPRHSVVVSIAVLVMFGAASAQGQTRLFVEASALFDQDGTYSGVGGTEPAVDLSVGVTLKESYTLRFSVEKAQWHERMLSSSSRLGDRIESSTDTYSDRTIAYALLAGRQFRVSHSLNVGVLYGVSLVDKTFRAVESRDDSTLDGTLIQHRADDRSYPSRNLAGTFGFETPIAVNHHLYVIPSLRFDYVLLDGLITRGGVGARWRF